MTAALLRFVSKRLRKRSDGRFRVVIWDRDCGSNGNYHWYGDEWDGKS